MTLAVIGGSGLSQLASLEVTHRKVVRTPYGEPSGALTFGRIRGKGLVFLARHGYGHTIAPHEVNYRANLWALKEEKVSGVVSVASVGGIRRDVMPGALLVPDQIIDYTWGRKATFFEGAGAPVTHIDFTEPYYGVAAQAHPGRGARLRRARARRRHLRRDAGTAPGKRGRDQPPRARRRRRRRHDRDAGSGAGARARPASTRPSR